MVLRGHPEFKMRARTASDLNSPAVAAVESMARNHLQAQQPAQQRGVSFDATASDAAMAANRAAPQRDAPAAVADTAFQQAAPSARSAASARATAFPPAEVRPRSAPAGRPGQGKSSSYRGMDDDALSRVIEAELALQSTARAAGGMSRMQAAQFAAAAAARTERRPASK